jgi:hypothetical protein
MAPYYFNGASRLCRRGKTIRLGRLLCLWSLIFRAHSRQPVMTLGILNPARFKFWFCAFLFPINRCSLDGCGRNFRADRINLARHGQKEDRSLAHSLERSVSFRRWKLLPLDSLVDISHLAAACFLFPAGDNLQISGAWRTKLDSLSHNNHFLPPNGRPPRVSCVEEGSRG